MTRNYFVSFVSFFLPRCFKIDFIFFLSKTIIKKEKTGKRRENRKKMTSHIEGISSSELEESNVLSLVKNTKRKQYNKELGETKEKKQKVPSPFNKNVIINKFQIFQQNHISEINEKFDEICESMPIESKDVFLLKIAEEKEKIKTESIITETTIVSTMKSLYNKLQKKCALSNQLFETYLSEIEKNISLKISDHKRMIQLRKDIGIYEKTKMELEMQHAKRQTEYKTLFDKYNRELQELTDQKNEKIKGINKTS